MRKQKPISYTEDKIKELLINQYFEEAMQDLDNNNVNINHLERIFTDETYYKAMKIVPLLERKVLYLSYIENCRLNEICKRLKLEKKQVVNL